MFKQEPWWLKHAVAVSEVSGSSPGRGGRKESVSAGLSKDSGSIHLIPTIQSQEQHNKTPYTLELNLGVLNRCRSLPPECPIVPYVVERRARLRSHSKYIPIKQE